jgi:3-oxoacyl-[acyl-carrier-protein] synthase II
MEFKRVVITGLGVITPIGNTVDDFWNGLLAGKSGAGRLTAFDPSRFSSQIAAEVKNFDPKQFMSDKELRRFDRFVRFGLGASKLAVENGGLDLDKEDTNRIGVYVGSGIGGLHTIEKELTAYHQRGPEKGPSKITPFLIPMLIANMAAGHISITLGLKGPNSAVVTACASGNNAIGDAFRIVQRGDADVMVAGGTEGATTPMGFGGFCALKALSLRNDEPEKASRPFDKERDGFVMGEGAGILILEEYERAKKRSADIYCEIIGYGMSADAYHMTAPDPSGDGAKRCMAAALNDAKLNPEDVDYINAHGTSTKLNDKIETMAIKNLFGEYAKKVSISSTKSMTGHLLGAAGGAEAAACALSLKNGIIHPTINYEYPDPECDLDYVPNQSRKANVKTAISNALGFGGHNATLTFRKI